MRVIAPWPRTRSCSSCEPRHCLEGSESSRGVLLVNLESAGRKEENERGWAWNGERPRGEDDGDGFEDSGGGGQINPRPAFPTESARVKLCAVHAMLADISRGESWWPDMT
jgi:hypothetical protein